MQPALETLRKDYPADVRIVWKNMPLAFHTNAEPAAEMTLEVPNFFINGRQLTGAQPYPAFKKIVDEELVTARALVASGTPRAMVYDKLSMGGAK